MFFGTIKAVFNLRFVYWLVRKINFAYFWHYSKIGLISKGKNTTILSSVLLGNPKQIFLGHDCYIGNNCVLFAKNQKIVLGDFVLLGQNVQVYSSTHSTCLREPFVKQAAWEKGVFVGSNVWIGANTVILPGTIIGSNVVIGANSVVTKNSVLADNCFFAGCPVKKIGKKG